MAKMTLLRPGEKSKKGEAISAIQNLEKRHKDESQEIIKQYQTIIYEDHQKYLYLKNRLLVSRSLCALLYVCMCILGYIIYTTK
jgi:hypothetical protein